MDMKPADLVVGLIGGILVAAIAVGVALMEDVAPDARADRVGQETDSCPVLIDEALDTQYAEPTPAPHDTVPTVTLPVDSVEALIGDLQAAEARLGQHDDWQWREIMEVER